MSKPWACVISVLFSATIIPAPASAAVRMPAKVEVFPIVWRAGGHPGQYAVVTISNSGPAVAAGELFLVVSSSGQNRQTDLPALDQDQTLSVNLSLPLADKPSQVTITLRNKQGVLDTQEVQTQKPEPFTFYIMPSSHMCFGFITGHLNDHWGAAEVTRQALRYLDKYPNFAFNMEAMYFLKDYLDKHPEDRPRVEKYLQERRLYAGGWMSLFHPPFFLEDEMYVRQVTMAQWWLKKEFGLTAPVILDWDADAIRLQTPQIFAQAGVKTYFRGRNGRSVKPAGDPHVTWTGPADSEILTCVPAAGLQYNYFITPVEPLVQTFGKDKTLTADLARNLTKLMEDTVKQTGCRLHGGTIASDQSLPANLGPAVAAWNEAVESPNILITTVPVYLEDSAAARQQGAVKTLEMSSGQQVFWWRLEASLWEVARNADRAAASLADAEKAATLDTFINGTKYPRELLNACWDHLVFICQHEQTCADAAENAQYTRGLMKESAQTAEMITTASLERLAHRIALAGEGKPLVVWNLLSWDRQDVVEVPLPEDFSSGGAALYDSQGQALPCELIRDGSRQSLRFRADVPGMGYQLYYLRAGTAAQPAAAVKVGADFIENDFYRVTVDKATGCLKSIFDKDLNLELLAEQGNELRVLEDTGYPQKGYDESGWGAEKLTGKAWSLHDSPSEITIRQEPFRAVMTVRGPFFDANQAKFGAFREQTITLWAGMKRIDGDIRLDWSDPINHQIRLELPFAFQNPRATYDTQYGTVDYVLDDPGLMEREPTRESARNAREISRWISLYDAQRNASITLVVPETIQYFDGGHISSLLHWRAGWIAANYIMPLTPGLHTHHYSITSSKGDWKAAQAYRFGREQYRHQEPLRWVFPERLTGPLIIATERSLPPRASLLKMGGDDVILTTLKMAENGYDLIARGYEIAGKPSTMSLDFYLQRQTHSAVQVHYPRQIDGVVEANLLEEPGARIDPAVLKEGVPIKAGEIKTLRLNCRWGAKTERKSLTCPSCNKLVVHPIYECPHCGAPLPPLAD